MSDRNRSSLEALQFAFGFLPRRRRSTLGAVSFRDLIVLRADEMNAAGCPEDDEDTLPDCILFG